MDGDSLENYSSDGYNAIVWREGMFLAPQHFQQQTRYFEQYCHKITNLFNPQIYGFSYLEIDHSLSNIGKITINKASGIFPDGTPFDLLQSLSIDINTLATNSLLYLALPKRDITKEEVSQLEGARYYSHTLKLHDNTNIQAESVLAEVMSLCVQLKHDNEPLQNYTLLPIARIKKQSAEEKAYLSKEFIPVYIHINASEYLQRAIQDLYTLMQYRVQLIENRYHNERKESNQQLEQQDLCCLQILNSWLPLFFQWKSGIKLLTQQFYFVCIQLAGMLSSINYHAVKNYPSWNDDDHYKLFSPLFNDIRKYLHEDKMGVAIELVLDNQLFAHRRLLRTSIHSDDIKDNERFILEVISTQINHKYDDFFSRLIKVAGNSQIAKKVNNGLSGIKLNPLSSAPLELITKENAKYYELDKNSELWKEWDHKKEPLALHIDGQLNNIKIHLYIIR